MSFPKYPEYKDSGVEWLGEVPAHWAVVPVRAFVEERDERNDQGIGDYLSLMAGRGVLPYAEKGDVGNKKPEDLSKCKIVEEDDLVINSMNYGIGSYGISRYRGVCSPVYIVLTAVPGAALPRYALRVFEEKTFQRLAQSFGQGILAHRAAIGWHDIKNLRIALPPWDEQERLSQFLDHETGKIDALIEEQRRLIELLKEKRQAVISHAVTKGLDPNVPMKDSGVEWLGEVPAHWGVVSLSRVLSGIDQGWSPAAEAFPALAGDWGVIKLSAIRTGQFVEGNNKKLPDDVVPDSGIEIHAGDLLVTRANTPELVGDACVVRNEPEARLIFSDLVYRLKISGNVTSRFLCYVLLSDVGRAQLQADARGSSMSMAKISHGHIKSCLIPLPPVEEQNSISSRIDQELAAISTLTSAGEQSIGLLTERRSALISAAVTGKIDVRGWATGTGQEEHELPMVAEESVGYSAQGGAA
ncbi:hypothetical protein TVD_10735 [Thioalkalivibrio versutus]|uniref:Restriction endonuclease subunit S n=1 Tax=Thioalkalivibrio versutus TaxID=106634 RepID=A0A0G3G8E3_9GAMM|nr:restriction endonuclease subunit S [Thioalkalivibrio versutus]AKJ95802.1 hypothetical protein TVD_10735 [Thioalkalivibrio versutus]